MKSKPEFNRYDPLTYRGVSATGDTFGRYVWGATWYALKKAWRGYKIAFNKDEWDNMMKYARRIRWLEYELGKKCSQFPHLNLYGQETERPEDEGDERWGVFTFKEDDEEEEREEGDYDEDEGFL